MPQIAARRSGVPIRSVRSACDAPVNRRSGRPCAARRSPSISAAGAYSHHRAAVCPPQQARTPSPARRRRGGYKAARQAARCREDRLAFALPRNSAPPTPETRLALGYRDFRFHHQHVHQRNARLATGDAHAEGTRRRSQSPSGRRPRSRRRTTAHRRSCWCLDRRWERATIACP